jgi:hypothetical protein
MSNGTYDGSITTYISITESFAYFKATANVVVNGPVAVQDYGIGNEIENLGHIQATAAGSEAIDMLEGVTLLNGGVVQGVSVGVYGYSGDFVGDAGSAANSGTIKATGTNGIGVQIGTTYHAGGGTIFNGAGSAGGHILATASGGIGVEMFGSSYAKNNHVGVIAGNLEGVDLVTGGGVYNTGTIGTTGTAYATAVEIGGSGSVFNSGVIGKYGANSVSSNGIFLEGSGTVTNSGTIDASSVGVDLVGGGLVSNSGLVSSANLGVYDEAGTVTNAVGAVINGGSYGVVFGVGTGNSLTDMLSNQGLIEAGPTNQTIFSAGAGIRFGAGGSIGNSGTVTDQGGGAAIWGNNSNPGAAFGPTVNNSGLIEALGTQHATFGVYLNHGILVNQTTGTIAGQSFVVEARYGGQITNHGLIHGFGGFTYGSIGIVASGGATIANDGQIVADGTGGEAAFITGGSLSNSGTMSGANGIELGAGCAVTNSASGTIAAYGTQGTGLRVEAPFGTYHQVNVVNSGLIESLGSNGRGAYLMDGILTNGGTVIGQTLGVDASDSTIVNSGTIRAIPSYGGIGASMSGGYIDNLAGGKIRGTGQGVVMFGGSLVNQGTILANGTAGPGNYGLALGMLADYGTHVTNALGGVVSGQIGIEAWGTTNYAPQAVTVTNSGTIESSFGATGIALEFMSAGGLLIAESGSDFIGTVDGGGGTLTLASGHGTIDGISDFAVVKFANAATWTFDGDNIIAGGLTVGTTGTVIAVGTIDGNGGTAGVAVDLTASSDLLIVEAGAGFAGSLIGGGGGLEFVAGSAGSLSGVNASGFATIDIDAGASWSVTGGLALAGGKHLDNAGTFDLEGTISGTGTITNEGTLAKLNPGISSLIAGTFTDTGSIVVNGGTLAFSGPAETFSGAVTGSGALAFIGGGVALNSGTALSVSNLSISAGVVSVNEVLGFAGSLALTGGRITVAAGDTLTLSGINNSLSATVNGAGSLAITGGSDTLNAGASIQAANWSIMGSGTMISVNESTSFAGAFADSGGISVGSGDKLILSGTSTLAGAAFNGAGIVYNSGSATASAVLVGGSAQVQNAASLTVRGGNLTIGDTVGSAAATLNNLSSGTVTFADNSGILSGISAGDHFTNSGTLAKTGSGTYSTIAVSVTDTGTMTIASGAVLAFSGPNSSFTGAISGAGTLAFTGGMDTINGGSTIGTSDWAIASAAKVTVNESLTFNGTLDFSLGTLIIGANTLQLGGGATIAGAISGGTGSALIQSGGTDTFNIGATIGVASWTQSAGTLNVNENLNYIGAFTQSAGTIAITGILTFAGPTASLSGKLSGAGGLTFSGGSATVNAGASVSTSNWSITGSATSVTLAESLTYTGQFSDGGMVTVNSGFKLVLSGTAGFAGGTVNGAGILYTSGTTTAGPLAIGGTVNWQNVGAATIHGGNLTIGDTAGNVAFLYNTSAGTLTFSDNGGILSGSAAGNHFTNAGMLAKTGSGTTSTIAVSTADTGAITIASGATLAFGGPSNSFAASIGGAGTVSFTGGSSALNSGTTVATTKWSISGGKVSLGTGESLSYTGALSFSSGTLALGANTLTLSGANTLAGAISGTGTLAITGGTDAVNSGATVTVASWTLSGGTVTVNENLSYAGVLTQSAGTLSIGSGDTLGLTVGADVFAGKVQGAGTLKLASGSATINTGATVSVANWTISGSATTLTLAESLSYAGVFASGTNTLSIASGDKLILSGATGFAGTLVKGSGILYLSGPTTSTGLFLTGAAELENTGTVTQSGNNLIVGQVSGDTNLFYNTATGIWNITDNTGIGSASSSAAVNNKGLLEKTGGNGISKVTPGVTNSGTIAVTSGTLDLHGAVAGTGAITIGTSGTLQVDGGVAATETVSFAGTTGGELILNDPSGSHLSFQGVIAGFGGSDAIDLSTFAYSTTATRLWTQTTSTQGTLTVTDGTKTATLTLNGTYTTGNFTLGQDPNGFIIITDPPASDTSGVTAPAHHADATAAASPFDGTPAAAPSSVDPGHAAPAATPAQLSAPTHAEIAAAFAGPATPRAPALFHPAEPAAADLHSSGLHHFLAAFDHLGSHQAAM